MEIPVEYLCVLCFFFFQAEDGIRDDLVTGVQTCALPIFEGAFYVEDAIKVKPSLELRFGFRGESTNGWNEAHGRASNYAFDSNGVVGKIGRASCRERV